MTDTKKVDPAVFEEINTAVLDLQASKFQTYERPLKRLAKALNVPELAAINQALRASADFDAFLKASEATGGGMVGSRRLKWPEDREQELGLTLVTH